MCRLLAVVVLFAPASFSAAEPPAGITLIGVGTLPGDTADLSGLTGKRSDGTPHNRLGGLGSAVAYTGKGSAYLLASDSGPKDEASDYVCRVHTMTIAVRPGAAEPVKLTLTGTTLLADETGRRLIGTASATDPAGPHRFDPEGIRVGRGGHFYLADEYGPAVAEFDTAGRRVKSFPVPKRFAPERPAARPEQERGLPDRGGAGRGEGARLLQGGRRGDGGGRV
ncbi:MAG TPA: esterase-like activity of phytase family protein [Urbifossiella sp.]|nr:esterase-like activity of phytase family protein [Urbifossiella sp.]